MTNKTVNNLVSDFVITIMPYMDKHSILNYIAKCLKNNNISNDRVILFWDWIIKQTPESYNDFVIKVKDSTLLEKHESYKSLIQNITEQLVDGEIYFVYKLILKDGRNDEKYQIHIPIEVFLDSLMINFEKTSKMSNLYVYIVINIMELCKKKGIKITDSVLTDEKYKLGNLN